jgi:hypothetical protein
MFWPSESLTFHTEEGNEVTDNLKEFVLVAR